MLWILGKRGNRRGTRSNNNNNNNNNIKEFSFIVCLMIVTLILITKSGPHTAVLHQVIVPIYWVELFVPPWLLVIGVSQTLFMVWARFVFASIQEVLYEYEIWVYSTINRQTWVKLGKTMALNRQSTSPWPKPSFHKDLNTTRQLFALTHSPLKRP